MGDGKCGGGQRLLIFLRVDWILKPYHTANITFKWWIMEYVEGSHITASFFVSSDTTRLCLTVLNSQSIPVLESLNSFPILEERFSIIPLFDFLFFSRFILDSWIIRGRRRVNFMYIARISSEWILIWKSNIRKNFFRP